MNPSNDHKDDVTIGTSIVCIVAALAMILFAARFRTFVERHRPVYLVTELHDPPAFTQNTFDVGPYLWLPALAASIWGFRLLITRPRAVALSWFLWSFLLTILILSLMTWSLVSPLHRFVSGPSSPWFSP